MPPTLVDIAKATHTSVSTVSRVLAGGVIANRISKETRERVEAAARELGYRPNLIARTLRTRRSNTVALLVSDIANPFFAQMASLIEHGLHSHGYSLMLCNSGEDMEREAEYLRLLDQKGVDGLILVPILSDRDRLLQHISPRLPLVVLDRPIAGISATVSSDQAQAARILCEALHHRGVRRVALVCGPSHVITHRTRADMVRGCFTVVAQCEGPSMKETGRRAHDEFAAQLTEPPDAIICTNNALAQGVMEAMTATEAQHDPPVVVGVFDEVPMMHLLPLPIIASMQDIRLLAEGCVRQLLPLLPGQSAVDGSAPTPEPMIFPARIVMNPAFEAWERAYRTRHPIPVEMGGG